MKNTLRQTINNIQISNFNGSDQNNYVEIQDDIKQTLK
jgi:hypothetical protein